MDLQKNKLYDEEKCMSVYSYVCFRKENEALLDVLIVGAGQAGLTMGYYLKQEGYNFLLLEGRKPNWRYMEK